MAPRLPSVTLWLVGIAIAAMLSNVILHLPIPYGDQFDEIYFTLTQTAEEVFSRYLAAVPGKLFRPFEWGLRFLIVDLFGPYLNSYGYFQISLVCLVTLLALGLAPARSWSDAGAALTALTFLFGHHAFLAVMEANITISNGVVLLLMLVVLWIIQSRDGLLWQLLAVAISVVAVLTKEVGLTIPFALVLGAMLGFPGVRRWTAAVLVAVTGAYLAYRFVGLLDATEPGGDQNSGKLAAYLSNVLATPALFIVGEPWDGDWSNFLARDFHPWRVLRIAAGLATVGVIVAGFCLRHAAVRAFPEDELVDRKWMLLLLGVLAACAALGFHYTRHRFGAMVLPIAFLLFYRSLRIVIWRLSAADLRSWLRLTSLALLLTLSTVWSSRVADSFLVIRFTGAKTMVDWVANYADFKENERNDPNALIYLDGFFWGAQDMPWPTIQRDPAFLQDWLGSDDVLNR